jgi:hypothetical protein
MFYLEASCQSSKSSVPWLQGWAMGSIFSGLGYLLVKRVGCLGIVQKSKKRWHVLEQGHEFDATAH